MPTYKLTEHSDNYSTKSGSLWKYFRDEPALIAAGILLVIALRLNLNKK